MYQTIEHMLSNLVTALTFSKLRLMHPSIISTNELYTSLQNLESRGNLNQLPFEVSHENVINYSKLITLKSYIVDTRIVFILEVPMFHETSFDLYKLYPIPIWLQDNTFRVILPQARYLLLAGNLVAHESEDCQLLNGTYFCKPTIVQNVQKDNCETNIITKQNLSNCVQHEIEIVEPQIQEIEDTAYWVLFAPYATELKINCPKKRELQSVRGTFLLRPSATCQFEFNEETIQPIITEGNSQPLFIAFNKDNLDTINQADWETVNIEPININEINDLKARAKWSQINPFRSKTKAHDYTQYTLIILLGIIITIVIGHPYFRRWLNNRRKKSCPEDIELQEVQLPRFHLGVDSVKGGVI